MDPSACLVSQPIPIPYTRIDQLPRNRHADYDPNNRLFSAAQQEMKMKKNSQKALEEHRVEKRSPCYAKSAEKIEKEILEYPLNISSYLSLKQGSKECMEDCGVCVENDEYLLAVVLDGHGGDSAALLAKERFRKRFLPLIQGSYRGHPYLAFEQFLDFLHFEADQTGSGAMIVASLIEKATGHLFTATLGNCEAYTFQPSGTSYEVIPKSCNRNWKSSKEALRAAYFLEKPSILSDWTCRKEAKDIYFTFSNQSTNISRGIGNGLLSGKRECPGVFWKPKITSGQLLPGDFHLLGSESLYNALQLSEIVEQVNQFSHRNNLADELTSIAISRMSASSSDNVAALVLKVS